MKTRRLLSTAVALAGLSAAPTLAQFNSGSDGSDGALNNPTGVVDLSLAASLCDCDGGGALNDPCRWDCPSPVAGQGVYDAENWAVVFKYTFVFVPGGVSFVNHPSGAPVVWLTTTGGVFIAGGVNVNGQSGGGQPGPGGFPGGNGGPSSLPEAAPSGGLGPGGGRSLNAAGSYGTLGVSGPPSYGNATILPLIGGSGGAGRVNEAGGAAGGAILIASSGDIRVDGTISANGGSGSAGNGSGGAIRLVANNVTGTGTLRAEGGQNVQTGGSGRIRIEAAQTIDFPDLGIPFWTSSTPGPIFPPPGSPTLRAASVDTTPVPADPEAGISTTDVDLATDQPVTINIEATNIPVGTTVQVLFVPEHGNGVVVAGTSTPLADAGGGLLVATMTGFVLPVGRTEIQLKANWTP